MLDFFYSLLWHFLDWVAQNPKFVYDYSWVFRQYVWFSSFLCFYRYWKYVSYRQVKVAKVFKDALWVKGVVVLGRPADYAKLRQGSARVHVRSHGQATLIFDGSKEIMAILAHFPTWYLISQHSWLPLFSCTSFFFYHCGKMLMCFSFHVEISLERIFGKKSHSALF